MALAGFTAYTRLHGKYHHGRDVAAGIGIAFLLNWIFVEKFNNENIQFGSSGDGINITLTKTFNIDCDLLFNIFLSIKSVRRFHYLI